MARPVPFMKSMKLYDQVERIHNELDAVGLSADAPLKVSDLTAFDQYHYLGTAAVDEAIDALGLRPSSNVLEIGSGIGGPARYVADRAGCRVTALELQPDLHRTAEDLSRRCGLSEKVRHACGNILDGPPVDSPYDAIMSFLVFLHIAERKRLFAICREALKKGGCMFIEDFTLQREPSLEQRKALEVKVLCPYVPASNIYLEQLEQAGFKIDRFEDMTQSWREFTAERLAAFRRRREQNLMLHGEALTSGLDDFYSTVAELYACGVLGGARIVAQRIG
ncbi:MAG TPA: methyltransferase domain-containing protein [Aestuariivirgaceae bacterium]|jgi:cyclopropane fatty-acyl-phospholipid synthase-like methyltransferase